MRQHDMRAVASYPGVASRRAAEIEEFLARHARRLVGGLALVTGSRETAEEALQEALVRAWQRRDQPIDELAAWITVVAMNLARSTWRRRQAEQRALERVGSRRAPADEAPVVDRDIRDALLTLPERERQAALLHYVMDHPVAVVADALGVTDGTVKTLLFRARGHLAARLGIDDGGTR